MTVATAQLLVNAFGIYLACGAVFGVLFLWRWVGLLDPLAVHGTVGFRVLVFPGVTALWPVFAVRLATGHRGPPDEWTAHRAAARRETAPEVSRCIRPLRRAHRAIFTVLAVLLPLLVAAALMARHPW